MKSKQWKVKSDTLHITCCPPDSRPDRYDDEQTSNDVAAQPNMEVANKMSQASHMELTSVHTQQLSDTRNLLKAKEVSNYNYGIQLCYCQFHFSLNSVIQCHTVLVPFLVYLHHMCSKLSTGQEPKYQYWAHYTCAVSTPRTALFKGK